MQQRVRDTILGLWENLTEDDVKSTPMGVTGADIQLSTLAKKTLGIQIECKARKIGFTFLYDALEQAATHGDLTPVAIIKQDRRAPLAIVDAEVFFKLLKEAHERRGI